MLIGNSLSSSNLIEGTKSSESSAKLEEELNRFLNLLVTQLKNQDPLDPLDANEFTSQLVAFAGVEQQIFANANLEKLLKLEQTNQISALVDFIGTTIEASGRTVPLQGSQAEIGYIMPFGANTATITITNSAGLTVFQGDADTSSGKHLFAWDGKNNSGVLQPDGAYNVLVSGIEFSGNLLEITHTVFGRVTGAGVEDGLANLFLGDDITIAQDKVIAVKETKTASAGP
ncbi:MAG: flagellar hook assembly protein FlgD [Proteobacteria bacterium]|nr:flagellar hook assembly protein FlgD [Pseudomonadota bacterium]